MPGKPATGPVGASRGVQCVGSPGVDSSSAESSRTARSCCKLGDRGHWERNIKVPSFLRLSLVAYGTVTPGTIALSIKALEFLFSRLYLLRLWLVW